MFLQNYIVILCDFLFKADGCDQCKAAVQQFHTLVTTNSSKVLEIMKNVCAGLSTGAAEV